MRSATSLLTDSDRAKVRCEINRGFASVLKPKPRLNVWQWAEQNRYMAKGVSDFSKHGNRKYSTKIAPHQKEPQEAPTDPSVAVTVLVGASQVFGKTEVINNVVGYFMEHKPSNQIVMYPTIDSASKYSKQKLQRNIDSTPALAALLRPSRARDSGNTILVKEYLGGSIFLVGANSPPSLRGASGQVLIGDEIDSNEETAEGDAVDLLFKRGESFPRCVKILSSTPTITGASKIWEWFEKSDKRYWFVPCAVCNHEQTYQWKNVTWPKDNPKEAYYLCEKCAAALTDKQRIEMYHAGKWKPTAPFEGVRGFHMNGIYSPWKTQRGYVSGLHKMASDHIAALESPAKRRVFVNTFLTETFHEETEAKPSWEALFERREDYGGEDEKSPIVPSDAVLLLCSVDVQQDRLEVEVTGHGLDDEIWGIETRQLWGNPQKPETWNALDDLLGKSFMHASGAKMRIIQTVIDNGDGKTSQAVNRYVKQRQVQKVWAVKGSSTPNAALLATAKLSKKSRIMQFTVGTDTAKATIYARLNIMEPGPRYMHFPKGFGYDAEYFKQLTAESVRTEYRKGIPIRVWKKDRERNESLDKRVYAMANYEILNPNMAAVAANFEKTAPKPKEYVLKDQSEAQEKKPEPPKRRISMGGGFPRGGWLK